MRILFIIDSLARGGKERRLVELIKGISKKNIEYKLILLTDIIEFRDLDDFGIKPVVIKRIIKKDPLIFYKLYKICRKFKPDIINTWGLMPGFYAFPLAKLYGAKFVNSMIIDSPEKLDMRTRILSKLIFRYSDVIASNSFAGLKAYGVESEKTAVIYNGFDDARIRNVRDAESVKKELGVKTKFIIGMVAGFRYHKDYRTMIISAKTVIDQVPDTTFILVGDGPTMAESKSLAEGYDKIIFTGTRSDVESIMNICDIGILSTYTEGISNSIMEFMASGKPVIATEGGGTCELVSDNITGLLVPARSPKILASKIKYLLESQDLRLKMGNAGRAKIAEEFSIGKMINSYIGLFESVIKK